MVFLLNELLVSHGNIERWKKSSTSHEFPLMRTIVTFPADGWINVFVRQWNFLEGNWLSSWAFTRRIDQSKTRFSSLLRVRKTKQISSSFSRRIKILPLFFFGMSTSSTEISCARCECFELTVQSVLNKCSTIAEMFRWKSCDKSCHLDWPV